MIQTLCNITFFQKKRSKEKGKKKDEYIQVSRGHDPFGQRPCFAPQDPHHQILCWYFHTLIPYLFFSCGFFKYLISHCLICIIAMKIIENEIFSIWLLYDFYTFVVFEVLEL